MTEVLFKNEDRYMTNILVDGQKAGSLIKAFGNIQVCLQGKIATTFKGKNAELEAKQWLEEVLSEITVKECLNRLTNEPAMMPNEILYDVNHGLRKP